MAADEDPSSPARGDGVLDTRARLERVEHVVTRPPVTCPPSTSIADVASLMTRERISIVAVYGGPSYLGLVSQDDLAEAKLVAGYAQRREEADIRGT